MQHNAPEAKDLEDFHLGQSARIHEILGAHLTERDGAPLWRFAVWAPNAAKVSLIGEFNRWDHDACPMARGDGGIWSVSVPAARFDTADDPGRYDYPDAAEKLLTYKYAILTESGEWRDHADPCGFAMEMRPRTSSRLCSLSGYAWHDDEWMCQRTVWDPHASPVNIYEVHLASWRRKDGRMLTWEEAADELIPYVSEMGYTHIELLPVMEHPFDGSWGYQVSGYFAATARHGEPQGLMTLIDRCHQAGIGVILDWVPAHFPRDESGLRRFDGTCLYEHPDPRRGEMPLWGTCLFDLSRGEVRSFLLSSACFWLETFHADGLRVDAVSAMLYHDFSRERGQWLPNELGGNENLEGADFLRILTQKALKCAPGAVMIAEESTAYPKVTAPVADGGLGFTFKWNMGWMHDTLSYVEQEPSRRAEHHNRITFGLTYAFSEHFILPFSHDEVVHGRKSMIDKQPGDLWTKFAGLRALYGYMLAHPGKKLLFMGGEFGQFVEWNSDEPLEWFLLDYDMHPQLRACVRDLNRCYRAHSSLWEDDEDWNGFEWTQVDDRDNSVFAFLRTDRRGRSILSVTNFTPTCHRSYRLGLPLPGTLTELFNTDRADYGGSGEGNPLPVEVEERPWQRFPVSAEITVPPLSTVWFIYEKIYTDIPPEEASPCATAE
ncbi:MAG: 1,4-alpha-glucan branching protein GlgB [Clostridia bacterium]|nr:1,4-alpha-glucan branching protein GlgB [Clostridia bacterium]